MCLVSQDFSNTAAAVVLIVAAGSSLVASVGLHVSSTRESNKQLQTSESAFDA